MTIVSQGQGRTGQADATAGSDLGGARPRVSVVVPALNEARNLIEVLPELPAVEQVILVDGGSVDGTIEAARSVMPHITVVEQTRRGKGNALACGFEAVTGDIVVMFDADGSADPGEIEHFVDALLAGADFAKGSRFLPGGGSADITRVRDAGNLFLNRRANALFDTSFTDLCYGYNAFWVDVLEVFALPDTSRPSPERGLLWGDGFEIETLINCRTAAAGLAITEVPSLERARIHGTSNLRAISDGFRVLRTMYSERRRARRLERSRAVPATARPVPEQARAADPVGARAVGALRAADWKA